MAGALSVLALAHAELARCNVGLETKEEGDSHPAVNEMKYDRHPTEGRPREKPQRIFCKSPSATVEF